MERLCDSLRECIIPFLNLYRQTPTAWLLATANSAHAKWQSKLSQPAQLKRHYLPEQTAGKARRRSCLRKVASGFRPVQGASQNRHRKKQGGPISQSPNGKAIFK